jgi:hypothetical protein
MPLATPKSADFRINIEDSVIHHVFQKFLELSNGSSAHPSTQIDSEAYHTVI